MKKKLQLLISPFFLEKYYLLCDIRNILSLYKFKGNVLDVGCGVKPYRYLFKHATSYTGIDFDTYSKNKEYNANKPDKLFNKEYLKNLTLPYSTSSFDHSVAFEVLEHHKQPQRLIEEMCRVTKKGGYIMITVPFVWGLHEEPNDFQRFTKYGLTELFKQNNCKVLTITQRGSLFSSISMLINLCLCSFVDKSQANYVIGLILYFPFLIFQYICLFLDKIYKSKTVCIGYLVIAQNS